MANVTMTITKVEDRDTYVLITDQNGNRYSGFKTDKEGKSTGLAELHLGDEIEADVTSKEKAGKTYLNIGAFHVTARNEGATGTPREPDKCESPDTRRRSIALSYAKDLFVGKSATASQVIALAIEFDKWLETGKYEAHQTQTGQPKAG